MMEDPQIVATNREYDLGFDSVILEGDARTIIGKLSSPILDPSEISPIIKDAKALKCRFACCQFRFIHRFVNRVAHALAKEGSLDSQDRFWVEEAPLAVMALAAVDRPKENPSFVFSYLEQKSESGPSNSADTPSSEMVTFRFHQYQVVGRAHPTENDEHPKIYRMKLWATNEVRAKSKFWYFLRKLKKVKKSNGQVLAINEIFEKNPTKIKNYGIWLRYQSRTGYHNMYKEYRDTTLNGAVEQMYTEMASRHRVRFPCIQIIKTATIPAKLCKRDNTKQFHNSKIKFPLVVKKVRPPSRKLKTTYKASRPNLFM
ncbi:hypothetical protein GQ457_01G041270 [Hibiscus cannabinus]